MTHISDVGNEQSFHSRVKILLMEVQLNWLIASHHEQGNDQFKSFMSELHRDGHCPVYNPMKKDKITFFKHEPAISRTKSKMMVLKYDYQLFSLFFILSQNRKCDLHKLFKHENQWVSTSFFFHACTSLIGWFTTRYSDIVKIKAWSDVRIMDGSAMVNTQPQCFARDIWWICHKRHNF